MGKSAILFNHFLPFSSVLLPFIQAIVQTTKKAESHLDSAVQRIFSFLTKS